MPPASAVRVLPWDHEATLSAARAVVRGKTRTVMVAVDGSGGSAEALEFSLKHYNQPGDKVVFVHVLLPTDPYCPNSHLDSKYVEADKKAMESHLYRAQAAGEQVEAEVQVLVGEPRSELVTFANELRPDAVVVGPNNHNILTRFLLGSVSDHLAHHCACPVLIVKPNMYVTA